ncbi:MAG TPA: SRPBCC family protein [Streptosporangiaceae bacterium]|nr:SRPBCC family protein [Streptosporangiaceae bacterium]
MVTTQIAAEPAVPQLIVTSEFAAPRDLLFRAYTDPDLLAQWLGPRGLTLTVDHLDPHHGGTWRYTGSDAGGNKYFFHGVFHGTPSPDGIVQTVESDGMPGHVCLETVTFTERAGTTVVTQNTVYQSARDRDRALLYDMAEDIHESIERLEQLLARLVPVS